MALSSISRQEYLAEVQKQYKRAGSKKERTRLLDEAAAITKLQRKYLIWKLRHYSPGRTKRAVCGMKRGPRIIYDAAFHTALLICWHAMNDICAERLQPFLPELVPKLTACHVLQLTEQTEALLLQASRSTVARHIQREQRRSTVSLGTTKPGSLLKRQIVVRHGRWNEAHAGWLETDTVAHCGDTADGQFAYSYNFTDIATSWSEQVATMGKGERNTVMALDAVRRRLPFSVLGLDSDNGSEFINHHLQRYCERESISFTRSPPYKKNDNAHVEQKNWAAIRHIVGYARFDTQEQLDLLNELYAGPLRLYLNCFQSTRKRSSKLVDATAGKKWKYYFEAKTPYQRIMDDTTIAQATKAMLRSEYNKLNPVKLLAQVQAYTDRLDRSLW